MKSINPIKLTYPEGFDRAFTQLISQPDMTHKEAFNQLNEIIEEAGGKPKYSDYDSYRVSRRRRLKQ